MRLRTAVAVLLVGLIGPTIATTAWAQGLPTVAPADVGLSEERLGHLEEVVQGYVDDQAIGGAVTLIARKGGQAHVQTYGMASRISGTPMRPDTIFRIASMTKPITSVAVMMLYEEGRFTLDDPVGRYPAGAGLARRSHTERRWGCALQPGACRTLGDDSTLTQPYVRDRISVSR